jgi:hypothetical protein
MASKRPSKPSIKARQRNIIEGQATRGITDKQAAKEFGVTLRQYKTFKGTKNLRANYNRSSAYSKLYREGERKETRKVLGVSRITRYKYKQLPVTNTDQSEKQLRQEQVKVAIRYLYYKNGRDKMEWANYAREHNIPSSIKAIKLLHDNGRITDHDFVDIVKFWRDNYNITDDYFYAVLGDLDSMMD